MQQISAPLPVLTVLPMWGLSNRLRTIATGQILARSLGYGFDVYWQTDGRMPAHFLELFENPGLVFLPQRPQGVQAFVCSYGTQGPWFHLCGPDFYPISAGVEGTIDITGYPCESFVLATYHNLKPHMMTNDEFMRQKREFLQSLRPLPFLQADIDAVTSAFGRRMVGIHARTTDFASQWGDGKHPSLHLYFAQMDACLEEHPDTMFFVAADADEIVDAASVRYGNRVVSSLRVLQRERAIRGSMEGQAQAVVDVFCLAKTSMLIGTHRSSFSYEAAALGGIPLIEIAGKRGSDWHMPGSVVIGALDTPQHGRSKKSCSSDSAGACL